MTKYILIIVLALPLVAFAQDDYSETLSSQSSSSAPSFKNKNGQEVLPQAGEWSIGIGASTLLNYTGNLFTTGTNSNSNWWQYQNTNGPVVIQGKYMVSGTRAYKLGANINYYRDVNYYTEVDDNGTGPDDYVQDKMTVSSAGFALLAGIEERRGSGRIQGVYGADVYVNLSSNTSYSYEYGNAITETNQAPSTAAPFVSIGGVPTPSQGYRPTLAKYSTNWGAGVYGFIGVEAFLFPKFSLGGKFTWGVSYSDNGKESLTYEAWDGQSGKVVEYTNTMKEGYTINAGIGNLGGQITANFYF